MFKCKEAGNTTDYITKKEAGNAAGLAGGVDDGVRTHDPQNHNLML
jgi:hypothetical protein